MKFLVGFMLLALSQVTHANYQFSIGEEVLTQETFWRRKLNGTSSCLVQYLAKLTVLEVREDEILVKYESNRADSASCENGSFLSFEPHYLDTIRDQYMSYKARKSALQKIRNGISVRSMGEYSVGDQFSLMGWRWAVVEEEIGSFREGDLCRLVEPAYLEVAGFYEAEKQMLFVYRNSQRGPKECPENTLYFESLF